MPTTSSSSPLKNGRKLLRRSFKAIMKSYRFRLPKYDLPIRLRPWFIIFTCLIMALLAFLGFTNFSRSLPLNDKLLHFLCFAIATGVFYFIFDVEEDARRIWFWRHAGLIFTAVVCFFFGGLVFVQSMLPYKEFQFSDVVANLLGSSIGLYTSYYLERYYRYRREIAHLYTPLAATFSDSEDDVDQDTSTQLLPTHNQTQQSYTNKSTRQTKPDTATRLANVWDEREELFGDSDEEDGGSPRNLRPPAPKIYVTAPHV